MHSLHNLQNGQLSYNVMVKGQFKLRGFLNSDMKTIENGDPKFTKYSGQDFSELPLIFFFSFSLQVAEDNCFYFSEVTGKKIKIINYSYILFPMSPFSLTFCFMRVKGIQIS